MPIRSHLFSMIRGKAGPWVYSAHPSHPIIARPYVVPLQPNTIFQVNARTALTYVSGRWNAMTAANRSAWAAVAPRYFIANPLNPFQLPARQFYFRSVWLHRYLRQLGVVTDTPTLLEKPRFNPIPVFRVFNLIPLPPWPGRIQFSVQNLHPNTSRPYFAVSPPLSPTRNFWPGSVNPSSWTQGWRHTQDQIYTYTITGLVPGGHYGIRIHMMIRGVDGFSVHSSDPQLYLVFASA